MTNQIVSSLPVGFFAYQPIWSFFTGQDTQNGLGELASAKKATELTAFLEVWARVANHTLDSLAAADLGGETGDPPSDRGRILASLLASLQHASRAIIHFKKYQQSIDVPASFLEVGYRVLERSDRDGIQAGGLTVSQVARRYSGATSHLLKSPRKAKADQQGFIHDESGKRLFQLDPQNVLMGLEQIRAGHTHPSQEFRETERRDGH